jgi:hypothetical protein
MSLSSPPHIWCFLFSLACKEREAIYTVNKGISCRFYIQEIIGFKALGSCFPYMSASIELSPNWRAMMENAGKVSCILGPAVSALLTVGTTFVGCKNEFSSIRLADVRTVIDESKAWILSDDGILVITSCRLSAVPP